MDETKLPVGFGMALAMDAKAMDVFASMPAERQDAVLEKARSVSSKAEMQHLVMNLAKGPVPQNARSQPTGNL